MEHEAEECCVRVAIHVRPLIEKELCEGCEECLHVRQSDQNTVLTRGGQQSYGFDYVFGAGGRQSQDLYEVCARPLVAEVLKGFNATILAYGQTGSGKTYTMGTGNPSDTRVEGIASKAVREIFQGLASLPDDLWSASVSFVELHREEIRDLLDDHQQVHGGLALREVTGRGICIAGATEREVRCASDVEECLQEGSLARATGSTEMNHTSSRSHAILTLTIERERADQEGDGGTLRSKLHLVDLAGSERVKRTKAEGQRFKEGVSINKGLLALGKVISALVDGASHHVPYRDSKLTRLLQDSLGGNSRTVMIACVSPADVNLDETLNTLKYAARARNIRNKVVQNIHHSDLEAEVAALKRQLQKAHDELSALQATDVGALQRQLQGYRNENRQLLSRIEELEASKENSSSGVFAEDGEDTIAPTDWIPDMEIAGEDLEDEGFQIDAPHRQTLADEDMSDTSSVHEEEVKANIHAAEETERILAEEMAELEKQLEAKQGEMRRMEEAVERAVELQSSYEKHVAVLEREKEKLRIKLVELEKAKDHIRVEERARSTQKFKELEQRILQLRSQLKETEKLRREREGAEEQRQQLRADIQRMKQQKTALARQMEQTARLHRDEVRSKDHVIAQMRKQDRKNALRFRQLEQQNQHQVAIIERKNREAENVKKRLKDAMARLEMRPVGRTEKLHAASMTTPSQDIAKRLEAYLSAKTEMFQLRQTAKDEQSARAEVALEANKLRLAGGDDRMLQQKIAEHSSRIRDTQAQLVRMRAHHEGPRAEHMRWGRIRSTAEAKTALRAVFAAAVDSRMALERCKCDLQQKQSELDVTIMRLKVEQSARDAREKQISLREQHGVKLPVCASQQPRRVEDSSQASRPLMESSSTSTHSAARSGTDEKQWLSVEDESADSAGDSSDIYEIPDDDNDPEWNLSNATPLRARRKTRAGSSSTSASSSVGRSRSSIADAETEEKVVSWINQERGEAHQTPIRRVTISLLKQYLKGKIIQGEPFRAAGKDKAALVADALAVADSDNNEHVQNGENLPPPVTETNVPAGDDADEGPLLELRDSKHSAAQVFGLQVQ